MKVFILLIVFLISLFIKDIESTNLGNEKVQENSEILSSKNLKNNKVKNTNKGKVQNTATLKTVSKSKVKENSAALATAMTETSKILTEEEVI